jgi:hypothetical protein
MMWLAGLAALGVLAVALLMVIPRGQVTSQPPVQDAPPSAAEVPASKLASQQPPEATPTAPEVAPTAQPPAMPTAQSKAAPAAPPETAEVTPTAPPPTTYRVLPNVSGGVQNLRAGPAVKYPIIVPIPAGAAGIIISTCRASEDGTRPWCAARWRGHSGWISSCCIVDETNGAPPKLD